MAAERWSLPDEVFGTVPGSTRTTSFGGIRLEQLVTLPADLVQIPASGLCHHHDVLSTVAPLDPECDHIAGAYPFELADDLLDVLGVDVCDPRR